MARTRRLRTLLALWGAYWAGLAAVEVGPVLWEYLRIQATAGHGTVSWSFSGSLTTLSLALFGPPLVLWALWLLVPERGGAAREAVATLRREGMVSEGVGPESGRDASAQSLGAGGSGMRDPSEPAPHIVHPIEERPPRR